MCTDCPQDVRDPWLPDRLLTTERDLLMPLLRRTPEESYALRTACPGWTARQVLAHCAAALVRIVEDRLEEGVFLPEANARDVAERDHWPVPRILDELERGLTEAGPVIARRDDDRLDAVALGEWVHAGDIREAFSEPGAYSGPSLPLALSLLAPTTRRRDTPHLLATLTAPATEVPPGSASGPGFGAAPGSASGPAAGAARGAVSGPVAKVALGTHIRGRPTAHFHGDAATLIRIYSGRPLTRTRYHLTGATEQELLIYR
ncbi:maleylpyruvate isomerase family mycothiol-dependent enzyme [Streptomyces sp. NPDC093089]|uniref:maleylpyruvate isomerase family mycothiol-dependent enzyme n=1 Tax=Streptomyces sp. NPDC093089 TaxID=3366024 RepID=UPI0037F2F34F